MRPMEFFAVLMCAGCVASPAQLAAVNTQELCVDYAETIIVGHGISINGLQAASGQQLAKTRVARGATCAPAGGATNH